jgi:hypothetical protein
MFRTVSTAAILAAGLAAQPALAQCGGHELQTSQDGMIATSPVELAQRDGTTLRDEENRRSGGEGTAAPPGIVPPRGEASGSGQSSDRGTFTSPSTTGNPDSPTPGSDSSQSGGDGDGGSGSGSGSGGGGSGGSGG